VREEGAAALAYAVRLRLIARHLGELAAVTAALLAVPLGAALLLEEPAMLPPLVGPMAGLGLFGLALRRIRAPARVQTNEALVITTAIFVVSAGAGAVTFHAAGLAPIDALFEAISAVTTTGLSMASSLESRPRTFLFTRAWLQWVGGLGIVALSLALVQSPGIASRRLGASAVEAEDLLGSTRLHARRVLVVYTVLSAVGITGLWLLGAETFDAVSYGLAAVSTGGFAPHDGSLAALPNAALRAAVIALSLAGSVTLLLYRRAWLEGPRVLWRDSELRTLLGLGVLAALVLSVLEWSGSGTGLGDATLLAFSAQTTAGFSSVAVAPLEPASKLVLIGSMAIGGSVGSTAGGVKLVRVLMVVQLLRWVLLRGRAPAQAVVEPRLAGERLRTEDIQRCLVILASFAVATFASWFAFVAGGHPPLDSLFEVTSALGTVGLSTGVTSTELPALLKGVLCADMLLGRLEIVAVVVTLAPRTWIGRRNS
jgi:trk system potassium uptake protein TrkH